MEDPLDIVDFDPIQFINNKFPTEASLDDLDTYVVNIEKQINTLDDDISKAVQSQSIAGQQASTDIAEAQLSIQELFIKINDIKSKAGQSEQMVQEICADIKKLDYAKTHLQTSITSLKRLQMLITAVGQLELLAQEYQYRDAANLLDAVKQLTTHFDKYTSIPLIADIRERVNKIQIDLKKHVHYAFREIGQLVDTVADVGSMLKDLPGNMRSLSDACLVVDALGATSRKELLEEFVQLQLVPYEKLFGVDKPHFTLDQVERRWSWFKRLLKSIDSKFANVCPPHWRLPLRLCLEFTERTKIHLVLLLTSMESKDETDVHALLKALQTALRFEQEMTSRFANGGIPNTVLVGGDAKLDNLKSSEKLMYVPTDHTAISNEDEESSGFVKLAQSSIAGGITGVFDKFLGSYVLLERHNLEEMLNKLSVEEDTASNTNGDESGVGNVYGSSMNMFVFIKNSIKRCTALTTGQTFLSLIKELKTCMLQYGEMMRKRCPIPVGNPPTYKLLPGAEVGICYIVNTGEYCADVVPQLEGMIKSKISKQYVDKVDLTSETEEFMDIVAFALKVLTYGIMDRLEQAFRMMNTTNWQSDSQIGEESPHIHAFNTVLSDSIPKIRDSLSKSYYANFCTKLGTELLSRYLDTILKQKRISEMGSQQLLLDTYSLKTMLIQLQNLGIPKDEYKATPSSMYLKLINSRATHIEMILKLIGNLLYLIFPIYFFTCIIYYYSTIGTPEGLLVERFKVMWPDGKPNDLLTLMTIKGMKKPDSGTTSEFFGKFIYLYFNFICIYLTFLKKLNSIIISCF